MKNKKRIIPIIFLGCMLAVLLIGATVAPEFILDKLDIGAQNKGTLNSMLTPSDAIMTQTVRQTYSLNEILRKKAITLGMPLVNLNSVNRSLYGFHHDFPVEFVKQIDSSNAYVVYQTRDSSNQTVYLYCFFQNTEEANDMEYWSLKGTVLFSCKRLSYADFTDIAVGDAIEKVVQIDPATTKYCNVDDTFPYVLTQASAADSINEVEIQSENTLSLKWRSYHLLDNGILVITYESDDDLLTVADVAYYDDYVIPDVVTGNWVTRKVESGDLPQ